MLGNVVLFVAPPCECVSVLGECCMRVALSL